MIYVLYYIIDQKPEHKPPTSPRNLALPVTWATAVRSSQQRSPEQARGVRSLFASIRFSPHGSAGWTAENQNRKSCERAVCICVCEVSTPGGWHYDRVRGHRLLGGFSHYILLKVTVEKQSERFPSHVHWVFIYEDYKTLYSETLTVESIAGHLKISSMS